MRSRFSLPGLFLAISISGWTQEMPAPYRQYCAACHGERATGTDRGPNLIDSRGLSVLGIEHSKNKMNGRGVLLDIARFRGVPWLKDGEGIGNDELDACAKAQGVKIGRADFVIIRTGQMERCLAEKEWGGHAGGDAPGVKFENCYWCHEKEIAALITDTWGCEVRPNETKDANQPWHWVVIPAMGLCMGEIFYLKELAEDCAKDKVYEFFFCGPPLIITGGTGSPINPQAIK